MSPDASPDGSQGPGGAAAAAAAAVEPVTLVVAATAVATAVAGDGGGEDAVQQLDMFDDEAPSAGHASQPPAAIEGSTAAELASVQVRLERVEGLLHKATEVLTGLKGEWGAAGGSGMAELEGGSGLLGNPAASDNFIKVNVGGTVFTTRRSTLMRVPDVYLARIATGEGAKDEERDEAGNIYVDRDPQHFQYILNWLRDPSAPQAWPDNEKDEKGLLHELNFFGLKEYIVQGAIYVAAGFDGRDRLSSIEAYNPLHRKWSEVARFKVELSSPACAEMGGKMYITGGKNAKNHAVATVVFFDPLLAEITETTDLDMARFGHGLVMLDDHIYAVGGYGDDGKRTKHVERYSERTQKWERVSELLEVRSALGCDALRGKIYVAGGYGPQPADNTHGTNVPVKQTEVYDPETKEWQKVADLTVPRAHVCCVAFQDKLWAIGGYDSKAASQVVEIYDPDLDEWVKGPSLNKKRSVVVCTVLAGMLYAIGGYDGESYLQSSEVYDPEVGMWVPGPEMLVARGRHCACALPY